MISGKVCSVTGGKCRCLERDGSTGLHQVLCLDFLPDDQERIAGMTKEASWESVKAKGRAIFETGGVEIYRNDAQEVAAYVMSGQVADQFPVSDGGPYEAILSKRSWDNSPNVGGWVQGFLCDCTWGFYHSGQPGRGWSGRFCFEPDSMVLMADGSYKRIDGIRPGDMVESRTGPRRVVNVFENDYDGDMVELGFTGSCFPVRMTADHRVLCNDAFNEWDAGHVFRTAQASVGYRMLTDFDLWTGFVEAGDLSIGDAVLFAAPSSVEPVGGIRFSDMFGDSIHEEDGSAYWVWDAAGEFSGNGGRWRTLSPINSSIAFDDDFAYVLGWYLAEGSVEGRVNKTTGESAKSIVRWTLGADELDVAERLVGILGSWGCEGRVYDYPDRNVVAVKVSARPLAELFVRLCGSGSRDKSLSPEVMLAPVEWQAAFLDAYCSGDGTSKGAGRCIYTSSPMLARQVSLIVQRVYGVDASVHVNVNSPGPDARARGEAAGGNIYHIDYGMSYVQRRYGVDGFHTAHRVASSSRYHKTGKVYNLEVEGDHTYCVEGLLVHNCSHVYALLLAANMRARGDFMRDHQAALGDGWEASQNDFGEKVYVKHYEKGLVGFIEANRRHWHIEDDTGRWVNYGSERNLADSKYACDYWADYELRTVMGAVMGNFNVNGSRVAYTNMWGTESVTASDVYEVLLNNVKMAANLVDENDRPKSDDDEQWAFPYMDMYYSVKADYDLDFGFEFLMGVHIEEGAGHFEWSEFNVRSPLGDVRGDVDNVAEGAVNGMKGGFEFWTKVEESYGMATCEPVDWVWEKFDFIERAAEIIAEHKNYQSVMAASRGAASYYNYPLINQAVERILDIRSNQFKTWGSLLDIQGDEDVINLFNQFRDMTIDDYDEACRRAWEDIALADRKGASKVAIVYTEMPDGWVRDEDMASFGIAATKKYPSGFEAFIYDDCGYDIFSPDEELVWQKDGCGSVEEAAYDCDSCVWDIENGSPDYWVASLGSPKVTSHYWDDFVSQVEQATGFSVDSVSRERPCKWMVLWDPDGVEYEAEVERYPEGRYELMLYNVNKCGKAMSGRRVHAGSDHAGAGKVARGPLSLDRIVEEIPRLMEWFTIEGSYYLQLDDCIIELTNVPGTDEWYFDANDLDGYWAGNALFGGPSPTFSSPQEAIDWANSNINWVGDDRLPRLASKTAAGQWTLDDSSRYRVHYYSGENGWATVAQDGIRDRYYYMVYSNDGKQVGGSEGRLLDENVAMYLAQQEVDALDYRVGSKANGGRVAVQNVSDDDEFALGDMFEFWPGGPVVEITEIDGNSLFIEQIEGRPYSDFPCWVESWELRADLEGCGLYYEGSKTAYDYESFDEKSIWSYEGDEFTYLDMLEFYDTDIDHSEYPTFEDWEWDMVRSGFFTRVANGHNGTRLGFWSGNNNDGIEEYWNTGYPIPSLTGYVECIWDGDACSYAWALLDGDDVIGEGDARELDDAFHECDDAARERCKSLPLGYDPQSGKFFDDSFEEYMLENGYPILASKRCVLDAVYDDGLDADVDMRVEDDVLVVRDGYYVLDELDLYGDEMVDDIIDFIRDVCADNDIIIKDSPEELVNKVDGLFGEDVFASKRIDAKSAGRRLEYEDDLVIIRGPDGDIGFKGSWDEATQIGYESDDFPMRSYDGEIYHSVAHPGWTMEVVAGRSQMPAVKTAYNVGDVYRDELDGSLHEIVEMDVEYDDDDYPYYTIKMIDENGDYWYASDTDLDSFDLVGSGWTGASRKQASKKNATRHFTYAEMKELEDEIDGRELHNADRFKDGGAAYYGGV